jgi:hypothetical protein
MFNDADDFMSTMAEGGNAMRFQDVDGIGPKTAQKIQSVRGVQNPDDVADMSADELSDKAGISHSRATKAIKAGGGNPNQSKQNSSSLSNISTAGMTRPQGDFQVPVNEIDKARAKNDTMTRSEEAIKQDDRKRAPVTTDLDKWANNKAKFDYPGVDTPTQEPNLLPKDVKQDEKPETTDFEARDEQIKERNEQSFPRTTDDARGNEDAILETGDDRESVFSVMREVPDPDPFMPGVAPSDFEDDTQLPGFDTEAKTMGAIPSSQRLSKDEREGFAEKAPTSVLEMQGETQSQDMQSGGGTLDTALSGSGSSSQGGIDGKPPFREPKINLYNTGDQFEFTYESDRAGTGLVSRSGVVTRVTDDKVEVDVGNSNFYEIYSTGRVVSISDNFNRTMVGYTVVD